MSVFEISKRFSISETQHLARELIGGFEQEGQVAEEQSSPAGTVMRKRMFGKVYFNSLADFILTMCRDQ